MTDNIQPVETGVVQSELDSLAEELKALIVEAEFNSRFTLIEAYHEAGVLINQQQLKTKGDKTKLVQDIAVRIGRGERTLWYAVKFAETYPDINTLPEGKNISWNKIINKYLMAPDDPKEVKEEPKEVFYSLTELTEIFTKVYDLAETPKLAVKEWDVKAVLDLIKHILSYKENL